MRDSFKHSMRVFWAFIFGELTQTAIFIVAIMMDVSRLIPWACAGGFLIAVAVFAGRYIALREVNDEAVRIGAHGK